MPLDPLNNHQLHKGQLTADDVVVIRDRLAAKLSTVNELADVYQVSPETIRRVRRGNTWRHLQVKRDPMDYQGAAAEAQASLERLLAIPSIAATVKVEPTAPALEPAASPPNAPVSALDRPANYPIGDTDGTVTNNS